MKTIKVLPFLAFIVAVSVAAAFPPNPTPWGSTATISCQEGAIIGMDNCTTSGHDQCQVLLQSTTAADAFTPSNCGVDSERLKRN